MVSLSTPRAIVSATVFVIEVHVFHARILAPFSGMALGAQLVLTIATFAAPNSPEFVPIVPMGSRGMVSIVL